MLQPNPSKGKDFSGGSIILTASGITRRFPYFDNILTSLQSRVYVPARVPSTVSMQTALNQSSLLNSLQTVLARLRMCFKVLVFGLSSFPSQREQHGEDGSLPVAAHGHPSQQHLPRTHRDWDDCGPVRIRTGARLHCEDRAAQSLWTIWCPRR